MRDTLVPKGWDTVKEVVCTALELTPAEREAYLDHAYSRYPEFKVEIEQILSSYTKGKEFFERFEKDLGASDVDLHCLSVGEIVAERYEIRAFLARGGSGEVYEAWDREVRERVALKVLRPCWTSERAIDQFRSEVRLSRKIQNPHVCRVHDAGRFIRHDGFPTLFLSMELLEGETLSTRLRRAKRIVGKEALFILRQIAWGLDAAHRRGILHRDLKSSNVILVREPDGSERAVLTDFGIAAPVEGAGNELVAGTPAYMAPEQVEGRPLTPAADVYAFGVLAFEMSTGKVPFIGAKPSEQAKARLTTMPPSPRSLNPDLDPRWDRAILRSLSLDPGRRFQSAAAMIEALEHSYRKPLIAVVCILALAAGLWGWSDRRKRLNEAPLQCSVVVAGFEAGDQSIKTKTEAFREELISELASVPGVQVIAQTTSQDISLTPEDLRRVRKELRAGTVLSGSMRPEPAPDSPDEARVALQLTDTVSGTVLWSGSYKARPRDLPQIQETIVLASAGNLHVHLAAPQIRAAEARHSKSPEAYQSYLLAHYFMTRRNTADLLQALDSYKHALSIDETYALAWAGMAGTYNLIANRGMMPAAEAFRQSEEAAGRALALDPQLPDAWLVKGINAHHAFWKWDAAEKYFRRGAELAPGLAVAHHWLAGLLSERGRHDEALKEAELALQLDPLSPSVNDAFAAFLYRARRYNEAIERFESLTRWQPAFLAAKLGLAEVYSQTGRADDAVVLGETVVAATNRASFALAELGQFYGRAGRIEEARHVLAELQDRHATGTALASELAQVYNGLGDANATIHWLEEGSRTHDEELRAIKTFPVYDSLRADPRFIALVQKVGQ